ncbi:ankyrin repeat-containing protein At5g02620-like isoform X2 [Vigna unguiculata]|uniref:ankyrin repeat-containing protein At5g02620-like isoform X2 n=1 Tax=Vigna unguiculata TaxID=3917 RepID=UPI001015EA10|nr:ankyrin repeat-containing protein At5g02620-like isoform X2 [Vigna unguiculata]
MTVVEERRFGIIIRIQKSTEEGAIQCHFFFSFFSPSIKLKSLFPAAGIRMMKITPQISDSNATTKPQDGRELNIVVHQTVPGVRSLPELDKTQKRQIYIAAASGDWDEASSYPINHWWLIPLNGVGITALHVAVSMEQTRFVENVVKRMDIKDLESCKAERNTALCLAAITGNVEIAKILLRKNPMLLWIRDENGMLPIQLASSAGHILITDFLFGKTLEDPHHNNKIPFQDIKKLFFSTINNKLYTVASKLLNSELKLVTAENEEGLTALQMLAQFSLCEEIIGYGDIVDSVFDAMEKQRDSIKHAQLSKAMFDAAKSGNTDILELLLEYHPDLLFEVNSSNQSLLHIAILHRQKSVYKLILSNRAAKNIMTKLVDSHLNTVLHLAGKMGQPQEKPGLSTNHVVMSSEERWFQSSVLTKHRPWRK